jgi:dihydroorotase
MHNSIVIKNGRLMDPSQNLDDIGNIYIENGFITNIGYEALPDCAGEVIDAKGLIVCPGFIDLHCHLREPGFEDKETIYTGSAAAAKGGYTTICCMPNTHPAIDNSVVVHRVKDIASQRSPIRVIPIGCITRGRSGAELGPLHELFESGIAGFSDDGSPVSNPSLLLQAMVYSKQFNIPVIQHCEDTDLSSGGQMHEGSISELLGLPGIPAIAEEIMVARDLALAEYSGCHLHIAHVSTERSVSLIRDAKQRQVRVTAEVTPHHLMLTHEDVREYDTWAKVNPPLRTAKDVIALIEGIADGTIDVIATDHAPHTHEEKMQEFSSAPFGISGFETSLGCLSTLVDHKRLTTAQIVTCLSNNPARILADRFGGIGSLRKGFIADVVIVDPVKKWKVDVNAFISKGKNNPFHGFTLIGKVKTTIAGGRVVYHDKLDRA